MRNLYLPIEIWSREYHAKTLLAVKAVTEGWSVTLGPKKSLVKRLPYLPQGTVFQFGLHTNYVPTMETLKNAGHKIVAVDEEGLVTLNPEHYIKYRVSSNALRVCDASFCWGKSQQEMLRNASEHKSNKLHITGNPRIDLLRPELKKLINDEAGKIKQKYGEFILLNGNFGSYNHVMGRDYTWKSLESKGWLSTAEDASFHRHRIRLQGHFFNSFIEIIPVLSKAGYNIVIRPHPSESLEPWKTLENSLANGYIKVVREGNIVPWLEAANVVLHNGCTTAVEAFVLDKPVISYRPEIKTDLESELPNNISMIAENIDELLAILNNPAVIDNETKESRKAYLNKYLVGLDGPMACELMVNSLPKAEKITRNTIGKNYNVELIASKMKRKIKKFFALDRSDKYVDLKCSDLELKETAELVAKIRDQLEIKQKINVSSIGDGMIHIR